MNYLQRQNLVRKSITERGAAAFEATNRVAADVANMEYTKQRKILSAAAATGADLPANTPQDQDPQAE